MIKDISLEKLEALCDEYDEVYEKWPESMYEGKSVLNFILEKLNEEK